MDPIEAIQAELDAAFPGTRLEYIPQWGYWIITDFITAPDGSPATGVYYPTPWNLLQLTEGRLTNRKLVFLLSHPDTGEAVEPSCENILNTMYRAYTGGSSVAFNRFVDQMEEKEAAERRAQLEISRGVARDSAARAWDRHKGKIISSAAGTMNYAKTDEFIGRQLAAQSWADAEAAGHRMKHGAQVNFQAGAGGRTRAYADS